MCHVAQLALIISIDSPSAARDLRSTHTSLAALRRRKRRQRGMHATLLQQQQQPQQPARASGVVAWRVDQVEHKALNKTLLSSHQGTASVFRLTPASMDNIANSCHGDSSDVQAAWCAACNHTVPDGNVNAAILKSDAAHYTLVRPCCSPHAHLVLH